MMKTQKRNSLISLLLIGAFVLCGCTQVNDTTGKDVAAEPSTPAQTQSEPEYAWCQKFAFEDLGLKQGDVKTEREVRDGLHTMIERYQKAYDYLEIRFYTADVLAPQVFSGLTYMELSDKDPLCYTVKISIAHVDSEEIIKLAQMDTFHRISVTGPLVALPG